MIKYKIIFLYLIFISNQQCGCTQGENNLWHVNIGRTIDFNTNPPSFNQIPSFIFSDGPPVSVSDSDGEFLFYFNGRSVLNRNYEIMPNGGEMKGGRLSSQPAVALPFSNDENKYHLFYLQGGYANIASYEPGRLFYAVVDMSLDNGNGDVLINQRDILIGENLTGRLTVARGECGAMWVIAHELGNNRFLAYKVDGENINEPITSEIGTLLNGFLPTSLGAFGDGMLKISPNFKKLALFGGEDRVIEIFDFNTNSGEITNLNSLVVEDRTVFIPTGSFSPDNSKLYVLETFEGRSSSSYFQFDLAQELFSETIQSKTLIANGPLATHHSNIEIAPDGLLYLGSLSTFISRINSPNSSGVACDLQDSIFVIDRNGSGVNSFTGLHSPIIFPTLPIRKDSILLPIDVSML